MSGCIDRESDDLMRTRLSIHGSAEGSPQGRKDLKDGVGRWQCTLAPLDRKTMVRRWRDCNNGNDPLCSWHGLVQNPTSYA